MIIFSRGNIKFVTAAEKQDTKTIKRNCTEDGSRNATVEDFQYVIQCMNSGEIGEEYVSTLINFEDAIHYFESNNFQSNKTLIRFGV